MITGVTITSVGMPKDMLKTRDDFGKKLTIPALQEAIKYWYDKMLGRHFRTGAAAKYGYKRRAIKTIKRKEGFAKLGNPDARLPLIMSGRMKREVTRMIRVSGTGKRAHGVMTGPMQLSIKRSNYPDLAGEIAAVTQAEAQELANLVAEIIVRKINSDKTTTVTRISA